MAGAFPFLTEARKAASAARRECAAPVRGSVRSTEIAVSENI